MTERKQRVLDAVSQIPPGKVTSYGKIANMSGATARTVGFILSGLTKEESKQYPWQRVVNREGFISSSKLGERGVLQEKLLQSEGIETKDFYIVTPSRYWWI
jgi:methylated-DNA-protein-cysteine methyltransferase related protein